MRIPGIVLVLLAVTGCYGSHELGGSPRPRDGGPVDPPSDAGPGLACGSNVFLLGSWDMPEPMGSTAHGLDLDGLVSTGTGSSCVDLAPDFVSLLDGEPGVDNAMCTLVPSIEMVGGRPIRELLGGALDEGRFVHAIELVGLHDARNDPDVEFILHAATVIDGIRSSSGVPAGDQRVDLRALARGRGQIVDGRFRGQLEDFTLQLSEPSEDTTLLPLTIRGSTIAFDLSCDSAPGLHRAVMAGATDIDDLARRADAFMPGIGETVRSILVGIADMSPQPGDPAICQSVSLAYTFEGVAARR